MYIPRCASDLAFADIVPVYKSHLLTYLITYYRNEHTALLMSGLDCMFLQLTTLVRFIRTVVCAIVYRNSALS